MVAEIAFLDERPATRSGSRSGRSARPPLLVVVPSLLAVLAALSPLFYLVLRLMDAEENVAGLVFNQRNLETVARTAGLAAVVTLGTAAISLPLAWLTVRTDIPLRRVLAVITALPLVMPSYVAAFAFIQALSPRGLLQDLLEEPFGVERLPSFYGFSGAAFTLILLSYPYMLLSVRTALSGLDLALEESSRCLGRGPWQTFLAVTLPQLRPAIAAGGLLVAFYSLSDFGAVSLLRFDSFTHVIYLQYESAFNLTRAAASAIVLIGLAVVVSGAEIGLRGRSRYFRSTAGVTRKTPVMRLGSWRWPALGFCLLVVGLALGLPLGVLGYLIVRGIEADVAFAGVQDAAIHSLYVSALTAVIVTAAAVPLAFLTVRYGGRLVRALETATYLGFSLPGIVVALAFVYFGIRYATAFYQTLPLLILAYLVLFLPVALGSVRASLLQVSPHLEESARSLGRSSLSAFFSVTLPLLRPGMLAGAALVFLVTMKELPATLILSPIGFDTLATTTWSATAAARESQAALAAVIIVLASAMPMAGIIYWERRREW